ncbi:MAG: cysteine hydrolase [Pseudomonadota bacterium]
MLLGEIQIPEMVANLHWGGDNWSDLYLCACTGLYRLKTRAQGKREPFMDARPSGAVDFNEAAPAADQSTGLTPSRTALLIQDMQNDVIMPGGAFADSGAPDHAKTQNVVQNSARLAAACRAVGIQVIHIWFACEPGHPGIARNGPLFEGLIDANALVSGTWGAQPAKGLEPAQRDLVVEKQSMSAWETSRLESLLRRLGIDTLINTGAWTNMSVEHTARTAADKGFRVVVPEDSCSTMNADWHRASIDYAMANVATVTTTDAVISMIKGGRA